MSNKKPIAAALVVLAATASISAMSPLAYADNFDGSSNGCSFIQGNPSGADGAGCISLDSTSIHTVKLFGVNQWPAMASAIDWSLKYRMDRDTHLRAYLTDAVTPDVAVMDNHYDGVTLVAWIDCPSGATISNRWVQEANTYARTCRSQDLRFNANYSWDYNTVEKRRALACHELGHTIGLWHEGDASSCMRLGTYDHAIHWYSGEDKWHVNYEYPPA